MPHQLNLLPPVRRAVAGGSASLAGALGGLAAVLVLASGWIEWHRRHTLQAEAQAVHAHARVLARLQAEQGRQLAAGDTRALEQELAGARAELAARRAAFDRRAAADAAPAAWLDWLAVHWPAQAWLHRARAAGGRIDIEGYTLAPAELQAWMQRLAAEAPQAPYALTGLRLEQRELAPWGRVFWFELGAQRVPAGPEAMR